MLVTEETFLPKYSASVFISVVTWFSVQPYQARWCLPTCYEKDAKRVLSQSACELDSCKPAIGVLESLIRLDLDKYGRSETVFWSQQAAVAGTLYTTEKVQRNEVGRKSCCYPLTQAQQQ